MIEGKTRMDFPDNYPRPQLRRANWTDLCGAWKFAFDDEDEGLAGHWETDASVFDRAITVPFPPESAASGLRETGFHPILWYRRTFDIPPDDRPARLILHFGAVDYRAQVWVNGQFAGEHEGGQTPFSFDIARLLVASAQQVVVVRAFDDPHDLAQPRGKQYWQPEPAFIFYHRTSGIWQPVWLEPLGPVGIVELRWTPDLDAFGVGLHLTLEGRVPAGAQVRVRLEVRGQVLANDTCQLFGRELRRQFVFDPELRMRRRHAMTWAPDHPSLIEARIEVLDADGAVLDGVESYFGLRSAEVKDGQFFLNGTPTFLRLVLAQNYWPESHLAAPSVEAMKREIELAKALGFNGLRIHQKIEDPRFLCWCDRLGMMVWSEAPNAYVFTPRAVERLTAEWKAAVKRDYNHPSIVTWVPLNESWGVPNLDRDPAQRDFVKALYHLTKALDPTRPAIGNDGWQHAVGDILGVHDYALDGETLRGRYSSRAALEDSFRTLRPWHHALLSGGHSLGGEPVMVTEFGGLSFGPKPGEAWFGYGTAKDAVSLLAKYAELVSALLASTALAGFCYTQLTDTEQENNGLLTAGRQPKLDIDAIRAINTSPSGSVPSEVLDAIQMKEVQRRRAAAKAARPDIAHGPGDPPAL